MTNTTILRQQAEKLSERRANMAAQAAGYEVEHAAMVAAGTFGARDVEWVAQAAETADRLANELAEAEAHAWDAYMDESQREHYEYLAQQDNDY